MLMRTLIADDNRSGNLILSNPTYSTFPVVIKYWRINCKPQVDLIK